MSLSSPLCRSRCECDVTAPSYEDERVSFAHANGRCDIHLFDRRNDNNSSRKVSETNVLSVYVIRESANSICCLYFIMDDGMFVSCFEFGLANFHMRLDSACKVNAIRISLHSTHRVQRTQSLCQLLTSIIIRLHIPLIRPAYTLQNSYYIRDLGKQWFSGALN